jgi:hypothetical protein
VLDVARGDSVVLVDDEALGWLVVVDVEVRAPVVGVVDVDVDGAMVVAVVVVRLGAGVVGGVVMYTGDGPGVALAGGLGRTQR